MCVMRSVSHKMDRIAIDEVLSEEQKEKLVDRVLTPEGWFSFASPTISHVIVLQAWILKTSRR